MIKVRTARFPGMRPSNFNIDKVIVTDYFGVTKQEIRSSNVDVEISLEERREEKVLIFLENTPRRKTHVCQPVPEPGINGRDLFAATMGSAVTLLCLAMV